MDKPEKPPKFPEKGLQPHNGKGWEGWLRQRILVFPACSPGHGSMGTRVTPHPGLNTEAEHFQARGKGSCLLSFLYSKAGEISQVIRVPSEPALYFAGRAQDVRSCSFLVKELLFPEACLSSFAVFSSPPLSLHPPAPISNLGKGRYAEDKGR